jgi:hypothetical protein
MNHANSEHRLFAQTILVLVLAFTEPALAETTGQGSSLDEIARSLAGKGTIVAPEIPKVPLRQSRPASQTQLEPPSGAPDSPVVPHQPLTTSIAFPADSAALAAILARIVPRGDKYNPWLDVCAALKELQLNAAQPPECADR